MLYGAYGYTGRLIAEQAVQQGMTPLLAGRSEAKLAALAQRLGCSYRCFSLDGGADVAAQLTDVDLLLHCAGPFSATSAPMVRACLASRTHYLDITGEIEVFEAVHGLSAEARSAGVVLCPGVGFDVVPTDCVAARLKAALPDADYLALGFDSRSGMSPGTAKTALEGMGQGGKIRRDGRILTVPFAYRVRDIDFGGGKKTAVTIPWGDVSTAHYSTGIPNIEVYVPSSSRTIAWMRRANHLRPLLKLPPLQRLLRWQVDKRVQGPDSDRRAQTPTHVWGEATNSRGEKKTVRIQLANGYEVTVHGALGVVAKLLDNVGDGGAYTPSQLMGADFITTLPGSGSFALD